MKIALTGINGLLGQHLGHLLLSEGHEVHGIGKGPARVPFQEHPAFRYYAADITKPGVFSLFFEKAGRFDQFVHAAALTQVDYCEEHREEAMLVNVHATVQALAAAEVHSKAICYISTDFVFDGQKGDYAEEDVLSPVNWYGVTKQLAESLIQEAKIPWSIIRTCLVYGNALSGTRNNIITWVRDNLQQQKPIKVVSDQVRTPTYVKDLAKGIQLVLENNATGIYHISGKEKLTPYDMAVKAAAWFNLDASLMTRVDASTFSQLGKRPLKTGFVIEKAERELGYVPMGFEEGMRDMFASSQ